MSAPRPPTLPEQHAIAAAVAYRDGRTHELADVMMDVACACIAVFDDYMGEGRPPANIALVVWDDGPEYVDSFVFKSTANDKLAGPGYDKLRARCVINYAAADLMERAS